MVAGYLMALVGAAVLNSVDRIITRASLRRHDLSNWFLLVYQLACTIVVAPFAVSALARGPALNARPVDVELWLLIVACVAAWGCYSVASFRSTRLLELALSSTVGRLRLVITAVFGVVLFGERLDFWAIVGVVVLLLAFLPLTRFPRWSLSLPGLGYAALSTFAISFALIIDQALTAWLDPVVVVFIGFLGTTVIGALLHARRQIASVRPILWPAVVAGVCGAAGYYLLVVALASGPISVVAPLYQASGLLSVLAGIVLLGETERWRSKLWADAIATVGATLLTIGQ